MILNELLTCMSFEEIPVQLASPYPLKPFFTEKIMECNFLNLKLIIFSCGIFKLTIRSLRFYAIRAR